MKNNERLLPKRITMIDKIRKTIRQLIGYKEGKRFILETEPKLKKYTDIELSKLALIEEKLKKALELNEKNKSLDEGISEEETKAILEWTVQNAREGLQNETDKSINEHSLLGFCGLGQGITGITLQKMGLKPNINNVAPTIGIKSERHAFVSVQIPIKNINGEIEEKMYLVDTTFRQFFLRDEVSIGGKYIKDKEYGNKVSPMAGYWMLKMENGKELAEKLLEKGFVELTEENAKLYGDSFLLVHKERKNYMKIPTKKEMITNVSGKEYIENMKNPILQEEIDYDIEEFYKCGINIETPLNRRESMIKNIKQIHQNKENIKENVQDKNENEK